MNLFPKTSQASDNPNQQKDADEDQNVIHIDLTENLAQEKEKVKKIAEGIGKIEINDDAYDGDDMLAMMDEDDD